MRKILLEGKDVFNIEETLNKAKHLISEETGIIKELSEIAIDPDEPSIFHYGALLADTSRYSRQKCFRNNGGSALSRGLAKARAIGEAVERYCAGFYDLSNLIHASYNEVKKEAVDPRSFVLFSERQYSQKNFGFSRFSDSTKMNWIWGFSLIEKRPILVPACLVYVPYIFTSPAECITAPISTGLACANTLEEAILKGIYEVVERDAFMIMWLNKLSLPKLALSSELTANYKLLEENLRRFSHTRLELHLIYITLDIKIPTFLALIVDRSGVGPAVTVGAAASLNPELAMVKSIIEAAQTRLAVKLIMRIQASKPSPDDFMKITSEDEHLLLYSKLTSLPKLDFILDSSLKRDIAYIPSRSIKDNSENIRLCLRMFKGKRMNVIMVDVTTPDIAEIGFHVVKILIPGMQPLHFYPDHYHLGGKRLYELSRILGVRNDIVREEELNLCPCPFP